MNGIKLIFVISRHFKSDERIVGLLVTISNEICDKIESKFNMKRLFLCPEGLDEIVFLDQNLQDIGQATNILTSWKTKFEKTKQKLEEEGGDRWDFDQKPIKERTEYMMKVFENIQTIMNELKKFNFLLGPQLQAVTGNSEQIGLLIQNLKKINQIFINLEFSIYDRNFQKSLKSKLKDYTVQTKDIQERTIKLIETTFNDLRSSESAFDLLQKFSNLKSLDHIQEQLQKRYSDVLNSYKNELRLNKEIFESKKNQTEFYKAKPPVAGAIAWKNEIFRRVKQPIVKFI